MIFIKKIVIFSLFASNHVKQNGFTIFLDSRVVVLWLPTWELGPWNHPHPRAVQRELCLTYVTETQGSPTQSQVSRHSSVTKLVLYFLRGVFAVVLHGRYLWPRCFANYLTGTMK